MKIFLFFLLFVLSFYLSVHAQGKSKSVYIDYIELEKIVLNEYGFDQVLVNGIRYRDSYSRKIGHQFLLDDKLFSGSVVYKGKNYSGLELKYDICDQQLILFLKQDHAEVSLISPTDFISAFTLGDKYFSKYNLDGKSKFYQQVYDSGKLKCLYYWSKHKQETIKGNSTVYIEFSDNKRKNFLIMNGILKDYHNNSSFEKIFPKDIKGRIKQYMNEKHIRVKKSNEEAIAKLLDYCNSLL
jgi:hypothetical protein